MKLSVVIPCYNSAAYVEKCVESLLVGKDVEVVIVDDGSTDDTPRIADDFAARFPDRVKVVHQPNGGHGEAINSGLKVATGDYFRVVDSDDWVDEAALNALLSAMRKDEADGCPKDMYVTNYVYTHADGSPDNVIDYRHVFKGGKATSWKQTRKFGVNTYLTLHSVTFLTKLVRDSGVILPRHVFYEDNYFIYVPLRLVETFRYVDVDLYRYFIGREGQSVQSDVFAKRYAQQIAVSEMTFLHYDIGEEIKRNKKRGKCMYHNCRMLLAIATAGARLNGSEEAERRCNEMWDNCIRHDKTFGKKLRYRSPIAFQMFPGEFGRKFANFLYRTTRKIVKN